MVIETETFDKPVTVRVRVAEDALDPRQAGEDRFDTLSDITGIEYTEQAVRFTKIHTTKRPHRGIIEYSVGTIEEITVYYV